MENNGRLTIVDNSCLEAEERIDGRRALLNYTNGTFKYIDQPKVARILKPDAPSTYKQAPVTVRFECTTLTGEAIKRLRVHSDGKIKTKLDILATGTQTYSCGRPTEIISDIKMFNQFAQRLVEYKTKEGNKKVKWEFTTHLLPVRSMRKLHTLAPLVNADVLKSVADLFTAILLFRGIGYQQVFQELKLAKGKGERSVVYNVNTTVTTDTLQFKVTKIRVKKMFGNSMFFCSKTCKPVTKVLSALLLIDNETIKNIE